ncbi:MAG: N-6 DNA methylase [Desulfovibrio sp.]|nr:N-6 DNA methylase [Desulfovibrio sp.]
MDELISAIEEYKSELTAIWENRAHTTEELSYRPALDRFLRKLCASYDENINIIYEPKKQIRSRPDWKCFDDRTEGVYGYIEAKGFSPDAPLKADKHDEQIQKYLGLGNPVILTDGIEFFLYSPTGDMIRKALFRKPLKLKEERANLDILELFDEFFREPRSRQISEKLLIERLAELARQLKKFVIALLRMKADEAENEDERKSIEGLGRLWKIAEDYHDKNLKKVDNFASFIAQILSFGLLYAHRSVGRTKAEMSPGERAEALRIFWKTPEYAIWAAKAPPFKELFLALDRELESKFGDIGMWYDTARGIAAHIRLSEVQIENPDFHAQYEEFLKKYDPETREDFGVWRTPPEIADFMCRLASTEALAMRRDIFDGCRVIDPCCGTGTFIESVLKTLPLPQNSRVTGFEILPAPYAISVYRLLGSPAAEGINIRLVLTNALGDNTFVEPTRFGTKNALEKFFSQELLESYERSRPPLTLIIGNPPCSDSLNKKSKDEPGHVDSNTGEILTGLLDDFRPEVRKGRNNTQKQLSNEWVKFLRWALAKAERSAPAIFALVVPSSFLRSVSFIRARKYIYGTCSKIYVVEFDSDNRNPSGTANIFPIQAGRAILLATFSEAVPKEPFINYIDATSLSREKKLEFFKSDVSALMWIKAPYDAKNCHFCPWRERDPLYARFVPIASDEAKIGLFKRHCSGVKLGATSLLTHASQGRLAARCKDVGDPSKSYEEIKEKWYTGVQKPPKESVFTSEVRSALGSLGARRQFERLKYRPFLDMWCALDKDILGSLPSSGTRPRPELRAAFKDKAVFGFAVAPAPEDITREATRFCAFCKNLPDNDLVARQNAHIFCNRFPEYKKGGEKKWNPRPLPNISDEALNVCRSAYGLSGDEACDAMVFYAYGILSSGLFLERFKNELYRADGEFPSIPLTARKQLFDEIVAKGKELASLENEDYICDDEEKRSAGYVQINIPSGARMKKVNKDGRTTLKFIYRDNSERELDLSAYDDLSIGGYSVLDQWTKMYSYNYYRKVWEEEEISKFESLLNRIKKYKAVSSALDRTVEEILSAELVEI